MFYNGLKFPYYMMKPYYDFINASLRYYGIEVDFWMDYYSNKYFNPYPTEYVFSESRINPLEELGISREFITPLTFSKRDDECYMALPFSNNGFLELPIHSQVTEIPDNAIKLRSYYRMLCNFLYHGGYHYMTEDGELYPNKCYTIRDYDKVLLEKLVKKMKEC